MANRPAFGPSRAIKLARGHFSLLQSEDHFNKPGRGRWAEKGHTMRPPCFLHLHGIPGPRKTFLRGCPRPSARAAGPSARPPMPPRAAPPVTGRGRRALRATAVGTVAPISPRLGEAGADVRVDEPSRRG